MTHKKGQNATEYLIILCVVVVLALIIVGVMGGIPGMGNSGTTKVDKLRMLCQTYKLEYVSYEYGKVTCQAVYPMPNGNLSQLIYITYDEEWLKNASNETIRAVNGTI